MKLQIQFFCASFVCMFFQRVNSLTAIIARSVTDFLFLSDGCLSFKRTLSPKKTVKRGKNKEMMMTHIFQSSVCHFFLVLVHVQFSEHTRAKILNLSKNSQFRILNFSQNSQFQNLNFHKIHIFKISFFTQFTFSMSHFSLTSHF